MKRHYVLDRMASPKGLLPAALLTALLLRRRSGALRLALGTTLAVLGEAALKRLFPRRRPTLLSSSDRQSFPSGHSAASFAYLMGLALMAGRRHRALAIGIAAMGSTAVNVLRVREREHWPMDVVFGDVVGGLGLLSAEAVVRDVLASNDPGRPSDHETGV